MRAKIKRALPIERVFTYAELMETVAKVGGSMRDVQIMATHLNHQTIVAVGQRRIPDKRLRNSPPPAVTPPKRRRTEAPLEPDDDDDRTEDYAGPPVDVSEQELDAAKAKAAALRAAAALADADLATKKRQRRDHRTRDRAVASGTGRLGIGRRVSTGIIFS